MKQGYCLGVTDLGYNDDDRKQKIRILKMIDSQKQRN